MSVRTLWIIPYKKLMLSSPGRVVPCLKNKHSKVLLLGLPPRWLAISTNEDEEKQGFWAIWFECWNYPQGGSDIILAIIHLVNYIVAKGKIPNDWSLLYIINCYKGKGGSLLRGSYRGLKPLDQVMEHTCNHHKSSVWHQCHAIWFHAWERNFWCNLYPTISSWKISEQT